jgi:hypothetical protein
MSSCSYYPDGEHQYDGPGFCDCGVGFVPQVKTTKLPLQVGCACCNGFVNEGSKFCGKCGFNFETATPSSEWVSQNANDGISICWKCNLPSKETADFCPHCMYPKKLPVVRTSTGQIPAVINTQQNTSVQPIEDVPESLSLSTEKSGFQFLSEFFRRALSPVVGLFGNLSLIWIFEGQAFFNIPMTWDGFRHLLGIAILILSIIFFVLLGVLNWRRKDCLVGEVIAYYVIFLITCQAASHNPYSFFICLLVNLVACVDSIFRNSEVFNYLNCKKKGEKIAFLLLCLVVIPFIFVIGMNAF